MSDEYDVVVVGGGPIGLSAAYHCAKLGKKVLLLERFFFFNHSGSSGDLIRMFRTMYTEEFMAFLAKQSIDCWKQLADDSGEGNLIWQTGLLNFGDPKYGSGGPEGTLLGPIKNLEKLKMSYQVLNQQEIESQFPFKNLRSDFQGVWAPDNGCINLPLLLRTLHRMCLSYGVTMTQEAHVSTILTSDQGVEVHYQVNGKEIKVKGKKAVLTCGAYANDVLRNSFGFQLKLDIWEMTYGYYATNPGPTGTLFKSMWFHFLDDDKLTPEEEEREEEEALPGINKRQRSNLFYGFPSVPWGPQNLVRISVDAAVRRITDPSQRKMEASPEDIDRTSQFVRNHLPGVMPDAIFTGSCLQTNVEDNMFVLDHLPSKYVKHGHKNVVVFTAGWAMKFVPLIGDCIKQMLFDGETKYDISHFKMTRNDNAYIQRVAVSPPSTPTVSASSSSSGSSTSSSTSSPGWLAFILRSPPAETNKSHSDATPDSDGANTKRMVDMLSQPQKKIGYSGSAQSCATDTQKTPPTSPPVLLMSSPAATSASNDLTTATTTTTRTARKDIVGLSLASDIKSQVALRLQQSAKPLSVHTYTSNSIATGDRKQLRIGIVGSGMAGLYAALLLKDLNVCAEVEVLEADLKHIGGRVLTFRFNGDSEGKTSAERGTPEYYDYFDAGAMRFPDIPTMYRLIGSRPKDKNKDKNEEKDKYYSLIEYLNNNMAPDYKKKNEIMLKPYYLGPKDEKWNIVYYNRNRVYSQCMPDPKDPDILGFGAAKNHGRGVPQEYVKEGHGKWLNDCYREFKDDLAKDFVGGFRKLMKYDHLSTRGYLRGKAKYPESVVMWCEALDSATGLYDLAFVESIMDSFDFDNPKDKGKYDWFLIDGGTDRIVDGLVHCLGESKEEENNNNTTKIEKGKKVVKINPLIGEESSTTNGLLVKIDSEDVARKYDHVISTVPLGVLRNMDLAGCDLSLNKRTAIRTMRYDYSVKVALRFKTRWWEDSSFMKGKQFQGGKSSTDLPIRTIVYPSYGLECEKCPGVLIVSYTWSQDAMRIGGMEEEELVALCMRNLAEVHDVPLDQLNEMLTCHKVVDWYRNQNQLGAFALYGPGQFTSLFRDMIDPEANNRLHFAGEAASVHHAWIVGSLNSAYRAVLEILHSEGMHREKSELVERWGVVGEIDYKRFGLQDVEDWKRSMLEYEMNNRVLETSASDSQSFRTFSVMKSSSNSDQSFDNHAVGQSIVCPSRV